MQKIIFFPLFALAFSCSAQNKIALPPLTIEDVKNCIAFPKGEGLHTALCDMVDVWYAIEKKSGLTDEQAALVALNKLGEQMLKFSKSTTNEKK